MLKNVSSKKKKKKNNNSESNLQTVYQFLSLFLQFFSSSLFYGVFFFLTISDEKYFYIVKRCSLGSYLITFNRCGGRL